MLIKFGAELKFLLILVLFATAFQVACASSLPARFENNLIYLEPTLSDGRKVRFFTDTGGGWNVISTELFEQYKWPTISKQSDQGLVTLTPMPAFLPESSIPLGGINNFLEGHLSVAPNAKITGKYGLYDGFLGGRWHAEKIIEFDYSGESMLIHSTLPKSKLMTFTQAKLGFQKNSSGNYTTSFPSLVIEIGEMQLPMLFDTGASTWLTAAATEFYTDVEFAEQGVATSFLVASIFDQLRKHHPDWTFIKAGCALSGEDMLKIPQITIADHIVGPVWFTRRADHNFHDYMSSMMDRKIDGAIGGSALKYLNVIVDYPNETAYFGVGKRVD